MLHLHIDTITAEPKSTLDTIGTITQAVSGIFAVLVSLFVYRSSKKLEHDKQKPLFVVYDAKAVIRYDVTDFPRPISDATQGTYTTLIPSIKIKNVTQGVATHIRLSWSFNFDDIINRLKVAAEKAGRDVLFMHDDDGINLFDIKTNAAATLISNFHTQEKLYCLKDEEFEVDTPHGFMQMIGLLYFWEHFAKINTPGSPLIELRVECIDSFGNKLTSTFDFQSSFDLTRTDKNNGVGRVLASMKFIPNRRKSLVEKLDKLIKKDFSFNVCMHCNDVYGDKERF